jgi:hypothetical protein
MKSLITFVFLITFLNQGLMAREIKTEITINASPQKVWAIFSDFENYPMWNPFIKSIKGDSKVGSKISIVLEQKNKKQMHFKPKILALEPNKEFRWLGHLLFSGLFDGEHIFELIDNGNGTTTFKQSEIFKGLLIFLFTKKKMADTKAGFEAMNQKLKELAEK